ncbi:MAG: glycerol-3-phosphate acyltransferase [Phycisphaerae bacterium]|jgi:glycerol-3-phosphate acyltransferase PlsY
MWIKFVLMLVGAYLLGSIPAAYLGVKWFKGADIRKLGSGNVGSSNVAHTTSKPLALAVVLFDIGKGALAFWIAHLIGLSVAQQMAVGIAAIIGHNWPVFIGFRGGKGMAPTLGIIAVVSPLFMLIVLLTAYIPAIKKQMAQGVFLVLFSLPLWTWFAWDWFASSRFGIEDRLPITIGFIFVALLGYVRRLVGPRVEISRNVPAGELLLNRLFFDRDIRDRQTWIDRKPETTA